jgi:CheY-like chemotaxis protein
MPKSPRKILIIDDDPVITAVYRKRFLDKGFQVEAAVDTASAAHAVHKFQPDILLLDLNLGARSGIEFLNHLRSVPKYVDLPVVIVTAEPEDSPQLLAARQSAVTGVMRKSEWDPDAVFTAVTWALGQPQRAAARKEPEAFWPVRPS